MHVLPGMLLVFLVVAAVAAVIPMFVIKAIQFERDDPGATRGSTYLLHVTVPAVGLLLFAAAGLAGEWIAAIWLGAFFCLAFSSLRVTTIDAELKVPRSRRWFMYAVGFATVLIAFDIAVIMVATWQGNFGTVFKLLPPLVIGLVVCWKNLKLLRRGA